MKNSILYPPNRTAGDRSLCDVNNVSKIENVCLANLVQILCQEKKSYRLEISAENLSGQLWLVDGKIYSADIPGHLSGKEALLYMFEISQLDVTFYEVDSRVKSTKNIDEPLANLVIEAARSKKCPQICPLDLAPPTRIEDVQNISAQCFDSSTLHTHLEEAQQKVKRYSGKNNKIGKIIDSLVIDSRGHILFSSSPVAETLEDFKELLEAFLELVNLSFIIYNISSDDYICLLDSRRSMMLSPINAKQFLVIIFEG